jgi:hypothetical protein
MPPPWIVKRKKNLQMPENEDFAISFFNEMLANPAIHIVIAEGMGTCWVIVSAS